MIVTSGAPNIYMEKVLTGRSVIGLAPHVDDLAVLAEVAALTHGRALHLGIATITAAPNVALVRLQTVLRPPTLTTTIVPLVVEELPHLHAATTTAPDPKNK